MSTAFSLERCDRYTVRDCRADNNVDTVVSPGTGEGFTSNAAGGSTALPGVTTNIFQNNTAYANGAGTGHAGMNQNYTILVAPGTSVPLLQIHQSSPGTSYIYSNSATPTQAHNISTIP